jgi:hypothetical protein
MDSFLKVLETCVVVCLEFVETWGLSKIKFYFLIFARKGT